MSILNLKNKCQIDFSPIYFYTVDNIFLQIIVFIPVKHGYAQS